MQKKKKKKNGMYWFKSLKEKSPKRGSHAKPTSKAYKTLDLLLLEKKITYKW